jgi:leucyl aminopeptidase
MAGNLFARELVNLPPNILTPKDLAARARRMARKEGLKCRILDVPAMKKLNMGGILGVGQGSRQEPRLIVLEYKAPGAAGAKAPKVALVGKGITFDTGGISLKPGAGMDLMKTDMGGAAAVLGAGLIAARLKLPVNLTVIVPTAENMPDGLAIRPADVLTMASGKTVEVLNTDAEGRLILADALWYAERGKPDYIIDAATLTGACVVALGHHFAGLMSTSSELIDALKQAGGETFERVWHLPLVDEHRKEVEGSISDLKNLGAGREGGALSAGAFLAHFVDDRTPWAHLDIAGTAWQNNANATGPKGATGFGARLMARAMQILVD